MLNRYAIIAHPHAYEPIYGVIFGLCEDFFPWVGNYTRIGIKRPREDIENHPVTDNVSVPYTSKTNVVFIYSEKIRIMNTMYFNDSEDKCWNSLNDLNNKKNYFQSITKAPSGSSWDASGITRDGRKVIIELKHRNAILDGNSVSGTNFHSDGLFIEAHKHSSLMLHWVVDGLTPLYINFLLDGTVVIYNLLKITHYKQYRDLKVKSLGYDKMEMNARRYDLFLDDATIVKI